MKTETISRSYLETLSFADLVDLADEFGIDVPENLDRRFLIQELLEVAEEAEQENENMVIASAASGEEEESEEVQFPKNYNETQISGIFSNPAWLFVFWNLKETDGLMLHKHPEMQLSLRICFYDDAEDPKPEEFIEVQAVADAQEQYVLLPNGKKYLKIELIVTNGQSGKVLAFSPLMEIPHTSKYLNELQPGKVIDFPEIIKISGIDQVLMKQYKLYRHSFS